MNGVRIEMKDRNESGGVSLSWKNLAVTPKNPITDYLKNIHKCELPKEPRDICHNLHGIVYPGEMVALMGASGSGKTTLLNAINFRTAGNLKVSGDIMINGHCVDSHVMSIVSCFVEQTDMFFGTLTVFEHLTFQAKLRMGPKFNESKVTAVLKRFELDGCQDKTIGIPGIVKGISGGQMRRLSFASEILTEPSILFCDEPTSGLDFSMAKSLVEFLRTYADEGKTIICTIHQPSSVIFNMFDKINLLAEGNLAFFGKRDEAPGYFKNNLNAICPQYSNPADFYIEKLGVDSKIEDKEERRNIILGLCEKYRTSNYYTKLTREVENAKSQPVEIPSDYSPFKATWFTQYKNLLGRCLKNYIRNYRVILTDFFMCAISALLGGLIYFQSSEKENGVCTFDQNISSNIATALFYSVTIICIISVLSAVLAFPTEIPIYLRENNSSVYRCETYYLSKFTQEVPTLIILPAVNATIIYFMAQFGCGNKNFLLFLLVIILVAQSSFSLGHILSILTKSPSVAISLSALAIALQMLFSGFFLKKAETAPLFLTYFKFISVFNYGFDLLMINQWEKVGSLKCPNVTIPLPGMMTTPMMITDQTTQQVPFNNFIGFSDFLFPELSRVNQRPIYCIKNGAEILDDLKIRPKNKYFYIGMLVLLTIIFRLIAFLILRFKSKVFRKPKSNTTATL